MTAGDIDCRATTRSMRLEDLKEGFGGDLKEEEEDEDEDEMNDCTYLISGADEAININLNCGTFLGLVFTFLGTCHDELMADGYSGVDVQAFDAEKVKVPS